MKPARFEYLRPTTLDEALGHLRRHGDEARILAGGQSLMPMLNLRLATPAVVLDINRLPGLDRIDEDADGLRIGALVRHADLLRHVGRPGGHPLLVAAMPHVAHLAVRNRGTVCGSLALADAASELPACALCLGAEIHLASAGGERIVPADAFFLGLYETAIAPDEMIVAVRFPPPASGWTYTFAEISRRQGDFALAGLAAAYRIAEGRIAESRIVVFSVADRPIRSHTAEDVLRGSRVWDAAAPDLADLPIIESGSYSVSYKRHLARTLLRRSLGEIADRIG